MFFSVDTAFMHPHNRESPANKRSEKMSYIIFLKLDRSSDVVVLSKKGYVNKMNQILSDSSKFQVGIASNNDQHKEGLIAYKIWILPIH